MPLAPLLSLQGILNAHIAAVQFANFHAGYRVKLTCIQGLRVRGQNAGHRLGVSLMRVGLMVLKPFLFQTSKQNYT